MTDREQITHCEAYRAARTLFDYCNGRTCRICIFAEKVNGGYECQFKHIIPNVTKIVCTHIAEDNYRIILSRFKAHTKGYDFKS